MISQLFLSGVCGVAKDSKTAKRRGPKPKGPFEDKRRTLTTRITESTRNKLDDAAKASGRSLSQEIEHRLGRSFWMEDSWSVLGMDPRTTQFVRDILNAKLLSEEHFKKSVWDNSEAHRGFLSAIEAIVEFCQPPYSGERKEFVKWEKKWGGLWIRWWSFWGGDGDGDKPQEEVVPPPIYRTIAQGKEIANQVLGVRVDEVQENLRNTGKWDEIDETTQANMSRWAAVRMIPWERDATLHKSLKG
jgi:hypothetical protein